MTVEIMSRVSAECPACGATWERDDLGIRTHLCWASGAPGLGGWIPIYARDVDVIECHRCGATWTRADMEGR